MNYARVENGVVREVIPAVDPAFPEIPVEDRFTKAIIDQLVEIPDGLDVGEFWTYSSEAGFEQPVPAELPAYAVEETE